jgi:hypothetical protein
MLKTLVDSVHDHSARARQLPAGKNASNVGLRAQIFASVIVQQTTDGLADAHWQLLKNKTIKAEVG